MPGLSGPLFGYVPIWLLPTEVVCWLSTKSNSDAKLWINNVLQGNDYQAQLSMGNNAYYAVNYMQVRIPYGILIKILKLVYVLKIGTVIYLYVLRAPILYIAECESSSINGRGRNMVGSSEEVKCRFCNSIHYWQSGMILNPLSMTLQK